MRRLVFWPPTPGPDCMSFETRNPSMYIRGVAFRLIELLPRILIEAVPPTVPELCSTCTPGALPCSRLEKVVGCRFFHLFGTVDRHGRVAQFATPLRAGNGHDHRVEGHRGHR